MGKRERDVIEEYMLCSYDAALTGDVERSRNYLTKIFNYASRVEEEVPRNIVQEIESKNLSYLVKRNCDMAMRGVDGKNNRMILRGIENALFNARRLNDFSGRDGSLSNSLKGLRDSYLALEKNDLNTVNSYLGQFCEEESRDDKFLNYLRVSVSDKNLN